MKCEDVDRIRMAQVVRRLMKICFPEKGENVCAGKQPSDC